MTTGTETSWQTGTGFLEEFTGDVTEAWFATDAQYRNGEVVRLHLKVATPDSDEGFVEQRYGCGPGWASFDGGKTVKHESANAKFNKNTAYGKLINAVLELVGVEAMEGRGNATEAKSWVGLGFRFGPVTDSFKDKDGNVQEYAVILPLEIAEEGGSGKAEAAPAAKASSNGAVPKALMAKVKSLAKKADTHEEFVDAALEVDGVADNDELLAQVVDEAGIYAEVRA